jgi:hypothetical protein
MNVAIATWSDGLHLIRSTGREHELAGLSVRGLTADAHGRAVAIVGGNTLRRREPSGAWTTLAASDFEPSCCVEIGDELYLGTDDARVFRLAQNGKLEPVPAFETVAGRDTWYAGSTVINGKRMGPPLGVRSIAATADGALLANVHVGGIPRSTDRGASWTPTIEVDADVHEVCAHPTRAELVIAAAAVGLCISRDGGATWTIEHAGLHARYCSAVSFVGDHLFVAAAADHFAPQAAIYRRQIDSTGPLERVGNGLPEWLDGIADTGCVAARGDVAAICDRGGTLYLSNDAGKSWSRQTARVPSPGGVLIL